MTLREYISELDRLYRTGRATEHTYRPALQALLNSSLPTLTAINEPARTDCGAPDFILVRRRDNLPVAFVEAKDIGDADLDGRRQHREQFDRYRRSLDHIAFTDYLDFHLYENGEFVAAVRVADERDGHIRPLPDAEEAFKALLSRLAGGGPQRITSASRLAAVMAAKARLLADTVGRALTQNGDDYDDESLHGLFRAFRNVLIHDAEPEEFADLYAQTITYGLFAARLHDPTPETFSRQEAAALIPKTNPFLRRFFQHLAGADLDGRVTWIVDDLAAAFGAADLRRLLSDYGHAGRRDDPMIHFYEDFLAAYDPKARKAKGVWYTPQPVVRFIVRAVDQLLRCDFGLPDGLADASRVRRKVAVEQSLDRRTADRLRHVDREFHRVQILDPATGTGTFLAEVVRLVRSRFDGREGLWQDYVERDLLPRLNGFELLMASYAVAHLKLDLLLEQTGYQHLTDRRLHVYLTNSLETANDAGRNLFDQLFSDEANRADRVKRDTPVMVMMGNPPYNVSSQNKGEWITDLLSDYKKNLNERNIQSLSDDYIKFIRFAQYYIEKNGEGIVAFITNNSYIDGITHRQMRLRLLQAFDKVYIVNLHGSSKKHETSPDGGKDENIFGIQQGVAIALFVRSKKDANKSTYTVKYFDLYGTRNYKFTYLETHNIENTNWREFVPQPPYYFFEPKNFSAQNEYEKGFKIDELLRVNVSGVQTAQDKFLICFTRDEVERHINDLIHLQEKELCLQYGLNNSRDWSIAAAKQDVGQEMKLSCIVPILYRPFDTRYLYYTDKTNGIVAWPRYRSMRHMLIPNNLGIVVGRQGQAIGNSEWSLVFITNIITDRNLYYRGGGCVFPLFINTGEAGRNFDAKNLIPNFRPEVVARIEEGLGESVEPTELFDYIYAVLHSPTYRERYREMLRIDFPRVPYPADAAGYHRLASIGAQLRRTHLMEGAPTWPDGLTYPVGGSNEVDNPHWADGRVYVNGTQYVGGVAEAVWNAVIGGYQPAQKWLKDRRGRRLTHDDIAHYARTLHALSETLRLMAEVDTVFTLPA